MLQNIRNNVQGIFAKIIMAIIIVPFALFGIDSLLTSGGVVNVAEVNGQDVTELELQQMMLIQKRNLLSQMGENADPALLDDAIIRPRVLEQLIQETVLLQKAEAADIGFSDRQLDQIIVNMSQFQDNGQFSPDIYQNVLRSAGYTSAFFKQLLAKELLIKQLSTAISSTTFITEPELADIASILAEKRTYRYLTIPLLPDTEVTVSADEISEYYNSNLAEFQREEQVQLEYIEIKKQQFFTEVDEQRIREEYETEIQAYEANEERRVSHIFVEKNDSRSSEEAQKLALDLERQLLEGADFAELAKANSDDIGSAFQGGDLGYTSGSTFPEQFEEALSSLELNSVAPVLEMEDGFYLIKVTDIKALDIPSFEERADIIRQRLQSDDAEAEFISVVEDLKDYVFNADNLKNPAANLELSVSTTEWLSRSSTDSIFSNQQLKNAAFSNDVLVERNNSEVIELSPDHYIVVSVKSYREPEALPLEEVKSKILALLEKQKAEDTLKLLAGQLIQQLQGGISIEELAQQNDYQWQLEISKTRNSQGVDRELLAEAFNSTALNDYDPVLLADGSIAIISLEKIEAGSIESLPQQDRLAVTQELKRNYSAQDFSFYVQAAMAEAEITTL